MTVKPGRWSANPADVAPEFQDLWRQLGFCIPLWGGNGSPPQELISGAIANDVFSLTWKPNDYGIGLYSDSTDTGYATWSSFRPAAFGVIQGTTDPEFTVAALCRVSSSAGSNPGPISYTTTTGIDISDGSWALRLSEAGTVDWWWQFRSGGTIQDLTTSVAFVGYDEWALVVVTRRKGGSHRFYENGLLQATVSNTSAWNTSNILDLTLQTTDSNSAWSIGDIAFLAGWNRVLSDGEIGMLTQDPFGLIRPHIPLNDDAIAILDLTDTTVQNGYLQAADTTHTLLQSGVATESAIPHPTTSLDIRLDVDLKSLTAGRIVAGAHNDSAGTREVVLSLESGNTFQAHPNNDTAWNPAGTYWRTGRFQYRFLWSGTTWTAYYRSADGLPLSSDIGWTTHASTTKNNISGLTDVANTPFTLMRRYTGTGWSAADWYGFQIAIDGTVESSWKGGAVELGASSFTDEQGLTWTWTGTAPTKEGSFGNADSAAITVRARGVDVNPVGHMVLDGTGDYVATTAKAILDVTGDLELLAHVHLIDKAADVGIITKLSATAGYRLVVTSGGAIQLGWGDGTTQKFHATSAGAVLYGTNVWLRATLDVDNGASGYDWAIYKSDDPRTTPVDEVVWSLVGSGTGGATTSVSTNTTNLELGQRDGSTYTEGRFYGAWVINGLNGSAQVGGVYHDGTGDYITTTDKAALDITGDIDLRCLVTPDVWVPSGDQDLISKASGTAGNRSYRLRLNTTGDITLLWSTDGTNYTTQASDPHGFTAGPRWLRATMDVDNGSSQRVITFYTSNDSPSTPRSLVTWELLSQHTVSGTTSIFSGAAALNLGTLAGTSNDFTGLIHYAEVRNGINGTIVADPDYRGGDITADASGNTWTKNGAAYWTGPVLQADFRTKRPSFLYLDGNDDAETPDKSSFQITDMESVFLLAAADYTPSTNAFPFGQYNATGDQRSWRSQLTNTGQVTFVWSADGINTNNEFGDTLVSDLVPNGHHIWLRVHWDVDNGASNYDGYFHYSLDPINTPIDEVKWIQIGSVEQGAGTTSFFNSTATLKIGQTFTGKIYGAWLNNNGAWVASIDYRDRDMVVDGQGNVWTKNGSVWREWGDANFGINEYTLNGNTYWDTDEPLTLTAQIIQNDQVTPLTDEVVVVELVEDTDWQDYQVLFSGIDQTADKTVWDNAKMRLRWSSDG